MSRGTIGPIASLYPASNASWSHVRTSSASKSFLMPRVSQIRSEEPSSTEVLATRIRQRLVGCFRWLLVSSAEYSVEPTASNFPHHSDKSDRVYDASLVPETSPDAVGAYRAPPDKHEGKT